MSTSVSTRPKSGAPPADCGPRRNAEATIVHTRILRCMLAVDDCHTYWRRVDLGSALPGRADEAFSHRWFGTKSEARVHTLVADMAERFDPFPEALALLHQVDHVPAALRPWICHVHLQLADPIYRRFTGELLPERRKLGYTTIDRPLVTRWISEAEPERWSPSTCIKFASNLLATALEAGLIKGRRDPRSLEMRHRPGEAIGYVLYLLRGVETKDPLPSGPYLRSLGLTADTLITESLRVPGVTCARVGDHVDLTFEQASLTAWGARYLGGAP